MAKSPKSTPKKKASARAPSVGAAGAAAEKGADPAPAWASCAVACACVTFVYAMLTTSDKKSDAFWAFTGTVGLACMDLALQFARDGLAVLGDKDKLQLTMLDAVDASLLPVYFYSMTHASGGCHFACAGVTLCALSTLLGPLGSKVPGAQRVGCLLDMVTGHVGLTGCGRRCTFAAVGSALMATSAMKLNSVAAFQNFFTNPSFTASTVFYLTAVLPALKFLVGAASTQSLSCSACVFCPTNTLLCTLYCASLTGDGMLQKVGLGAGAVATLATLLPDAAGELKAQLTNNRTLIAVVAATCFSCNALFGKVADVIPNPLDRNDVTPSNQAFHWTVVIACVQFLLAHFKGGAANIDSLGSIALMMYLFAGTGIGKCGATYGCHAGLAASVLGALGGANALEGANALGVLSVLAIHTSGLKGHVDFL